MSPRLRGIVALLAVGGVVAVAFELASRRGPALPSVELGAPRDVLLISVDTLRPDHMSIYGYPRPTTPALDAFFASGEIYARAYAAEANTTPSVVSMLTGLYPLRHRVRLLFQMLEPGVLLLSDHLAAAGYQTAAVVSNLVLTDEAAGFASRFDHYDDFVDEREPKRDAFERRASRTTHAALRWLREQRDPERPHLLWVHYIDPHGPYAVPAGEEVRNFEHARPRPIDTERMFPFMRIDGVEDGAEYVDRYDEEIAYVDAQIGRLLARYAELGLADEAVVVFTADHGETMVEHEVYFNHGYHVWEPIMRVPLLIRRPGAHRGERVTTPVSLVDLMPTLLEAVGYPLPEGLDGVPLGERGPDDPISLEASGWNDVHHRAVLRGNEKWYASIDADAQVVDRWYVDLGQNPRERERADWPSDEGEAPELLMGFIEADPDPGGRPRSMRRGSGLRSPKVAPGRTPEQIEALRALGYVE